MRVRNQNRATDFFARELPNKRETENFDHSDLFRISDFVLRILYSDCRAVGPTAGKKLATGAVVLQLIVSDELDTAVKLAIYRLTSESGVIPNAGEVAGSTKLSESEVCASFARLHSKRLLVPEPGDPSRIRMAPPFSGIPTAFPVEAKGKRYFANCVWDAYGIAAALRSDAFIAASDGQTGEELILEIKNGKPIPRPYIAHFAVPAAKWWEDIVFT
jgi:Alkylmercury lyase